MPIHTCLWESIEVREPKIIRQGLAEYDPDGKLHWPIRQVSRDSEGRRVYHYFGEGYGLEQAEYIAGLLNAFPPEKDIEPESIEFLINATQELCENLIKEGWGQTSDKALPGEFDTVCMWLKKIGRSPHLAEEEQDDLPDWEDVKGILK